MSLASTTTDMRSWLSGNGEFGCVESLVFGCDAVQIYVKAVGELAYGHAPPPAPKSFDFFYEACHLGAAEQAGKLALLGGVALLHLAAAYLEALLRMFAWRSRWLLRCRRGLCVLRTLAPRRPVRGVRVSRRRRAPPRPRRRLQDAWPHIRDGISHVHGLWPSLSGFRRMNIRGRLRARSHAAEALPGSVSFTLCVMSAAPVTRIAW